MSERGPDKAEVGSSILPTPTIFTGEIMNLLKLLPVVALIALCDEKEKEREEKEEEEEVLLRYANTADASFRHATVQWKAVPLGIPSLPMLLADNNWPAVVEARAVEEFRKAEDEKFLKHIEDTLASGLSGSCLVCSECGRTTGCS